MRDGIDSLNQPEIRNLNDAINQDAYVHRAMKIGMRYEDLITALTEQKRLLINRLVELESIAPRKIKASDGKTYIWHCPDHLVPEK